ncbi:MAG: PhoH family protein [Leptospirales bacterium]|nr:PhoH family protein [Leptospirales bacterium]
MMQGAIEIDDLSLYKRICGLNDKNIRNIEKIMGVEIIPRGNTFILSGPEEKRLPAEKILHVLSDFLLARGDAYELTDFEIKYFSTVAKEGKEIKIDDINALKITIPETGKSVIPKTLNQARYVSAINRRAVTFGIGPAGTGKTYLAVAAALNGFLKGGFERIVLTRPAVEAGESLGFLPGDLIQKINPYLRPLYDSMFDLLSFERVTKLMEQGQIEIAPLAYMRGRTLNKSFIILDEAQNTTHSQMKMFLTRLGRNSKFVITGDVTQIDLDKPQRSGLLHAMKILGGINEIEFIRFGREDISRHPVVEKIVEAYEKRAP